MPSVPSQRFLIQYTDDARHQLSLLDNRTCSVVQAKLNAVAESDPYAHGHPDPPELQGDRRVMRIEGLVVSFWVSKPVKVLTVVSIREGDNGHEEPQGSPPAPVRAIEPPRPEPFEDEDEEIMVGPAVGATR